MSGTFFFREGGILASLVRNTYWLRRVCLNNYSINKPIKKLEKGDAKIGIVVGISCMVLAVMGIVAFSSDVQPVDSVSTDHEMIFFIPRD